MGPRPPRPGAAALAAKGSPRPVEVVRNPRRGPPAPPSAPLPEPVQAALASIAGDLRHLPRDCIGDAAELVIWLRRMAGRVEGVGRMRVPGALPHPAQIITRPITRAAPTPLDLADAVFGKGTQIVRTPATRTITTRRGRTVRVETRRARAGGQMELW